MSEEAHNQEQVIEFEHSPVSPPLRKHLRTGSPDPMEEDESDGEEQQHLIRSNAFAGHWPAKQPMARRQLFDSEDEEDDEDKDLAWFFKKFHPDVDKHSQIAWCRTFANCLAAQMPKNRPKTYKKTKTEHK